jgi:hypothetical protein
MGLDGAVKMINSPKPEAFLPLADKGAAVPATIKIAQMEIEGAGKVGLGGALQLQDSGTELMGNLNTLADDLVVKAPLIKQAGLAPIVIEQFNSQGDSAMGLMKAVIKALPEIAQGLAEDQLKQMPNPLDKVKTALMAP